MLRQKVEDGIVTFMQKLGTGYTMSFNKKYERVGPLFQGSFKAVAIEKDVHFLHLPFYIHANPVDLIIPKWREVGIEHISQVMNFLENYRWSSYRDYIGEKNFPSVTQRTPLLKLMNNPTPVQLRKQMKTWLRNFSHVHAATIRAVQIEQGE